MIIVTVIITMVALVVSMMAGGIVGSIENTKKRAFWFSIISVPFLIVAMIYWYWIFFIAYVIMFIGLYLMNKSKENEKNNFQNEDRERTLSPLYLKNGTNHTKIIYHNLRLIKGGKN